MEIRELNSGVPMIQLMMCISFVFNYFMEELEIYSGLCYTNEHSERCTRELGNLAQTMPANAVESVSTERN